jgi:deoxyxylulose-5-phosphate synthase
MLTQNEVTPVDPVSPAQQQLQPCEKGTADRRVPAVIRDRALTGGTCWEAFERPEEALEPTHHELDH